MRHLEKNQSRANRLVLLEKKASIKHYLYITLNSNSNSNSASASGQLLHNLLLFGRLLRGLGLDINPGRMIDLVQALGYIEIGHKAEFYNAVRSLIGHRLEA